MSTTSSPFPVYATVFCEGRSQPVFSGVTPLPLVSESKLRKVFKSSFAQVRKVAMCALKCDRPLPAFFTKLGGELHFTLEEALAPAPASRPKPKARALKRAKKKVARKILRVKRSLHMTKGKKPKRKPRR